MKDFFEDGQKQAKIARKFHATNEGSDGGRMKIGTSTGAFLRPVLCMAILIGVAPGCAGGKKPWRDYSKKDFSSADRLAGDKIERGRMQGDMYCNDFIRCKAEVSTREQALKTLGEPDLKKTIEGREVWFYRVDLGIAGAMDLIPVSFDEKGRGMPGYTHGGTRSMMAKESEL
jgi:hypothetical protein